MRGSFFLWSFGDKVILRYIADWATPFLGKILKTNILWFLFILMATGRTLMLLHINSLNDIAPSCFTWGFAMTMILWAISTPCYTRLVRKSKNNSYGMDDVAVFQ